jgi:hypothetical protein
MWEDELGGWLQPFLDRFRRKPRRRMCPLYVSGLIGPGDRKSVQLRHSAHEAMQGEAQIQLDLPRIQLNYAARGITVYL